MDFFYPNFTNDFWRVMGLCLYDDKNFFVDESQRHFRLGDIVRELTRRGMGIYDTAFEVRRTKNTASDKDLEVVTATDLDALLAAAPQCRKVVTTGQKATEIFSDHFNVSPPKVGQYVEFTFNGRSIRLYRMPSTSRAYPLALEKKAEIYKRVFHDE